MSRPVPSTRRLNEYFFTVGPSFPLEPIEETGQDDPDAHPIDLLYRAELLDRFPLTDNEETRVENGISDFCFPNGLRFSRHIQMPKFFCFVLTNGEGDRRYGNCLTTYEPIPPDIQEQFVELEKQWKEKRAKAMENSASTPAPALGTKPSPPSSKRHLGSRRSLSPGLSSDMLMAATGTLFAPKCLCLLSLWPFVNASRTWLMQLYRISMSPTTIPLERYICNFLLEVPSPLPGKVDVQYSMVDQVIHYPSPPLHRPISWSGVNYEAVFEALSPENIVSIFNYALLEQQILMHSSQLSLLSICAEVITNLLWPLSWCHVYIPLLPRQCLYIPTNSPVPFFLGFHTEVFNTIQSQLPGTVIVVDLDKNTVTPRDEVCCKMVPEKRKAKLLKSIRDFANLFERREKNWEERCLAHLDDPFTQYGRPYEALDDLGEDAQVFRPDWDQLRDSFFSFFVTILKDYRKFMIFPTKENPRPKQVFRQADFIAAQPAECHPFLEEFCKTQAFQSFIDARIQPDDGDDGGFIAFFDEAIEAKNNKSRFTITRRTPGPKPKHASEESKTIVALQPELTNLPTDPFVYNGFPPLQERWYLPPRHVPELSDSIIGKPRKRNVVKFAKTDDIPSDPATVVFSIFIMAYCPTVGRGLNDLTTSTTATSGNNPSNRRGSSESSDGTTELAEGMARRTSSLGSVDLDDIVERGEEAKSGGLVPRRFSLGEDGMAPLQFVDEPGDDDDDASSGSGSSGEEDSPEVTGLRYERSLPDQPESRRSSTQPPQEQGVTASASTSTSNEEEEPEPMAIRWETSVPEPPPPHKEGPQAPETPVVAPGLGEGSQVEGMEDEPQEPLCIRYERSVPSPPPEPEEPTPPPPVAQAVVAVAVTGEADPAQVKLDEVSPAMMTNGVSSSSAMNEPLDHSTTSLASASSSKVVPPPKPPRPRSMSSIGAKPTTTTTGEQPIVEAGGPAEGGATSPKGVLTREGSTRRLLPLKPKMRRRSEDLKEERLHLATTKLTLAFNVLQRMKSEKIPSDEVIYRSIIDASGRLGNVEMAMQALTEMNAAGIMPDATIYSCLVAAFALNNKTSYEAGVTLGELDWNKIRRPSFTKNNASKTMKLDVKLGTTPRMFKDAFQAIRMRTPTLSPSSFFGLTASPRPQTPKEGEANKALKFEESPKVIQESLDLDLDETALRDAEAGADHLRPKNLRRSTSMAHNSKLVKLEVLYGENLLHLLFPDLVIDTERETCPDCNASLSAKDIQSGWLADPNNYTTVCPLCAARNAEHRDESSDTSSTATSEMDLSTSRRQGSPSKPPPVRRFVARFSVHCADPNWVGSIGPGSPLWCEYLPPWVLKKEVQTILSTDGIDTLTSPKFRSMTQSSATIFWNLILSFREYCLPVTFLIESSLVGTTRANMSPPY